MVTNTARLLLLWWYAKLWMCMLLLEGISTITGKFTKLKSLALLCVRRRCRTRVEYIDAIQLELFTIDDGSGLIDCCVNGYCTSNSLFSMWSQVVILFLLNSRFHYCGNSSRCRGGYHHPLFLFWIRQLMGKVNYAASNPIFIFWL